MQDSKALAEPTRLRIVARLQRRGPVTVSVLSQELGRHIGTVSHALTILREAGLITSKKRGKFVTYSLNADLVMDGKPRFGCCLFAIGGTDCCA